MITEPGIFRRIQTIIFALFIALLAVHGQQSSSQTAPNIFIITVDGLRWQEVFGGADSMLLKDNRCVKDTGLLSQLYGGTNPLIRREKLLPFLWNIIASNGQLYGNRFYGNKVNVKNLVKNSYSGYNEIFTGYADSKYLRNRPVNNRNQNLPDWVNHLPGYQEKVMVFSSWNLFPYILNNTANHLPVNSGYERMQAADQETADINLVQDSIHSKDNCRYDQLTFLLAKQYIQINHPKMLVLSLGESDEYAHNGQYDMYLRRAADVDKMLEELWYLVQTDKVYKGNTTFIITTDHGRGNKINTWRKHDLFKKGAGETWLAVLGPGIDAKGEVKNVQQIYQEQIAQTIATLMGISFTPDHVTGEAIDLNSIAGKQD